MPSKTFIVISLSDRVNDLNNLIDSINRYDRFKDYDVNLIYQDFLGNRDKIRNKERFRKIYYYDQKLGCHGARVQLLKDMYADGLVYDVYINLDDDMELVEQTNYDGAIEHCFKPSTGFVLTNWARSEKILEHKIPNMQEKFIKQTMVYQGGGMVYAEKIARLMKDLPVCHAEFDDIWCMTSYINGYDNYRYLGSLAIHRVCRSGGMRAYMREKIRPLLCREYINYRIGRNGIEVLIPDDSDINDHAKELHRRNKK